MDDIKSMTAADHRREAKKILASAMSSDDPQTELQRGLLHAILALDDAPDTRPLEAPIVATASRRPKQFILANSRRDAESAGLRLEPIANTVLILPTTPEHALWGLTMRSSDIVYGVDMTRDEVMIALYGPVLRPMWASKEDLPYISTVTSETP